MAGTTIGNVIADFNTTLNLKVVIGATTATLDSATDDDGVALPTGTYFLTLDGNSTTSKEYIKCTLTGTALTAIQSVSRQGALTTGFARTHRKGATVTITDFASIRKITDLLDGTTSNSDQTFVDLSFTGTTTSGLKVKSLTTAERDAVSNAANGQIIYNSTTGELNQYIAGAWSAISAGSTQPNASATVAGKVEVATSAETIAGTDVGGTSAPLIALPSDIAKNIQSGTFVYGADVGGDDTYVVALTPALTTYTVGQTLYAKMTTANTGACTIDFGPGVKNIKTIFGNDPDDGDIASGKVYGFTYDGTNFIINKPAQGATNAEVNTGTNTTKFVNPSQVHNVFGKFIRTHNAASNTQTIAHGLGRIPRFIEMDAAWILASNGNVNCNSKGYFDGTTTNSIYCSNQNGSGVTGNSTTNIITIISTGISHVCAISADATNITLTWTSSGSGSNDIQVLWKAI